MQAVFAGDNFLRHSGEAPDVQELQLFAWQAAARGNDVHLNANPTQGQLLHKQYRQKKEELKDATKISILDKYGGEKYLEKAPKELLQGQTEEYVEYSQTGQVIHGKERAKVRSKYPEDGMSAVVLHLHLHLNTAYIVLVNNHVAVWGSWYDLASGTWGYACCHSVIHLSYCTGESGKEAAQASSAQNLLASSAPAAPQADAASKSHLEESGHTDKGKASGKKRHEDGEKFDQDKMAGVLNEERKRKSRADEGDDRFTKKSKGDERETEKFDVTEGELGASISSLSLTDQC